MGRISILAETNLRISIPPLKHILRCYHAIETLRDVVRVGDDGDRACLAIGSKVLPRHIGQGVFVSDAEGGGV